MQCWMAAVDRSVAWIEFTSAQSLQEHRDHRHRQTGSRWRSSSLSPASSAAWVAVSGPMPICLTDSARIWSLAPVLSGRNRSHVGVFAFCLPWSSGELHLALHICMPCCHALSPAGSSHAIHREIEVSWRHMNICDANDACRAVRWKFSFCISPKYSWIAEAVTEEIKGRYFDWIFIFQSFRVFTVRLNLCQTQLVKIHLVAA